VETVESSVVPICDHIKPGGQRCGSPAVNGYKRCFYHEGLAGSLPKNRNLFTAYRRNGKPGDIPEMFFIMPPLEDAAAIQTAFMQVLHGVAIEALNPKKARLMLSALHGASANLNRLEECLAQCQAKIGKKPPATEESATLSAKRKV
jgi:hypothetical protein